MTRPRTSTSSAADNICASEDCKSPIGSADYTINCELCLSCFHHKCINFTDSAYHSFSKLLTAQLVTYYCDGCKEKIRGLSAENNADGNVAPQLPSDRLGNVEKQLESINKTLDLLTGKSVPEHDPNPTNTKSAPKSYASVASKGIVQQSKVITVSDLRTINEEESHRRSIVVAGLPENGTDFQDVSALCKFLDPSATVQNVFRMGRLAMADDTVQKGPRLLKAHLPSSSVVKSVLGEARKLKDSQDFKGVFVRRSMTLEERQQLSALRTRCKALNEAESSPDAKYVVSYEKLCKFTGCELVEGRLVGGVRDR